MLPSGTERKYIPEVCNPPLNRQAGNSEELLELVGTHPIRAALPKRHDD
jgi:hypothetical protein